MKQAPPEQCYPIDAAGIRLNVGDPVVSTADYDRERTYTGRVVALWRGRVVEIRRDDGRLQRCSARLWKRAPKTEPSTEPE